MKGAITSDRMEQAIEYLSFTDETCAALRADMERAEFRAKRTKSAIFKISDGSVAERNATADTSSDTEAAYEQYFTALQEYHTMVNKRSTESIVVETWRSLNANRRQGG
jgi:hypothetical protein